MKEKYKIKDFSHEVGVHCESTSLRDMLEFYGFPMSEARAFGLDATMGFGFFDYSENFTGGNLADLPMFIGGKQDTINPKSLACRLLGIQLRKQSYTSSDKAWNASKKLILEDTPLMLQVDLGFLNYMEIEDEDFHFGGHFITLGGYNESTGIAYVGESDLEKFQKVPITQLKKARGSEYGPSFMHPKNSQYSMIVRPDGKHPPVNAGLKLAIKKVVDHMLRPSMASNGLQGLKNFAENILNWDQKLVGKVKNPTTKKEIGFARLTFELMHGNIEKWGTGGALFRNLYKDFLEEILSDESLRKGKRRWEGSEIELIEKSIPILAESANRWTQFASILKTSAQTYKDNCLENVDLEKLSNLISEIRVIEEDLFSNLHQIKL